MENLCCLCKAQILHLSLAVFEGPMVFFLTLCATTGVCNLHIP